MDKRSLDAIAHKHLKTSRDATSGRSGETIYGSHERLLRQTLIALTTGTTMAEHESPGEATLLVVTGHVRLSSAADQCEGLPGELIAIPPARHTVEALTDSAVLLTVAKDR